MENSGRGVRDKKQTVEHAQGVSVFNLRKWGVLAAPWGHWTLQWEFDGKVTSSIGIEKTYTTGDKPALRFRYSLTHSLTGEKTNVDYMTDLIATPCCFGGVRYWFRCAGKSCGRRVAKFYSPPGASYFLCRHCHNLTYRSRQDHRNKLYEAANKFSLCRKRLERDQNWRRRLRWYLCLSEACERFKACEKNYNARAWARLERLQQESKPRSRQRQNDNV